MKIEFDFIENGSIKGNMSFAIYDDIGISENQLEKLEINKLLGIFEIAAKLVISKVGKNPPYNKEPYRITVPIINNNSKRMFDEIIDFVNEK